MWQKIKRVLKEDTVLSLALILAVVSMFFVHPDQAYIEYIDFRTLAILFCLMAVVAGLKEIGLFDFLAQQLLTRVKKLWQVVFLFMLLCFFFAMVITNDVALITFVPMTIIVLGRMGEGYKKKWLIPMTAMETVAANLGSMLTPIGNPQNLYLYGKANMGLGEFVWLMLPYSVFALLLLTAWIVCTFVFERRHEGTGKNNSLSLGALPMTRVTENNKCLSYFALFIVCLLTVARILPYGIPLIMVVVFILLFDRRVLKKVDYSLLGTFIGLFLFIGNLGRIPAFRELLSTVVDGNEILTAVLASQIMSNVPAALLLSGFTDNYPLLVIGVNLGGLGSLIASMASLISFKYIAKEDKAMKGRYLLYFSVSNLVFLAGYFLLLRWM